MKHVCGTLHEKKKINPQNCSLIFFLKFLSWCTRFTSTLSCELVIELHSALFMQTLNYLSVYVYIHYIYFKNTKNLFIHIARIPIGDSPRDIPTF